MSVKFDFYSFLRKSRKDAWEKLAGKYSIKNLNEITNEISLDGIKDAYEKLLNGTAVGRYLVKIDN